MSAKTNREIEDLKQEIESFKEEKERVRAIIGQIGGVPSNYVRFWNIVFIVFVLLCFFVSLFSKGHLSELMTELGVAAVSVKLIVLMHYQMKVNHFQLWILSSMEWKINELTRALKDKNKDEKANN